MSYDQKCFDLALHFLSDLPQSTAGEAHALAQDIQDAVENFFGAAPTSDPIVPPSGDAATGQVNQSSASASAVGAGAAARAERDLSAQIMKLPCRPPGRDHGGDPNDAAFDLAYKAGHRDCRHAAAELVADASSAVGHYYTLAQLRAMVAAVEEYEIAGGIDERTPEEASFIFYKCAAGQVPKDEGVAAQSPAGIYMADAEVPDEGVMLVYEYGQPSPPPLPAPPLPPPPEVAELAKRVGWMIKSRRDTATRNGQKHMTVFEEDVEKLIAALRSRAETPPPQPHEFPYQQTFNAIAAAVKIEGSRAKDCWIAISVDAFRKSFNEAPPQGDKQSNAGTSASDADTSGGSIPLLVEGSKAC